MSDKFKLIFFVPVEKAELVKEEIFSTGAGTLGNYAKCSFESEGIGQFLPLADSNPRIGKLDEIERVRELKVEILCTEKNVRAAIKALKKAHPYEEVAYEVLKLEVY